MGEDAGVLRREASLRHGSATGAIRSPPRHPHPSLLPSREKGPERGAPAIFARFWSFLSLISPLPRAVVQECAGVGTPHTPARFGPISPDSPLAAGTGDRRFPALQGTTGGVNPGPVWPRLLLAGRLEMRPPWPRLALRSLLRGGPAWPCCGLGWPRQEWPGVAKLLKPSHLVSFRLIPLVDWGWGFTLILSLSPQGRRDLTVFTGTTGVGGATAGSRLSRWDGGRLRWCTLATPGIGPGRSRPRHACRNLGDGGLRRV